MPAALTRPNAGNPWTPEETGTFRRLAAEGVALDLIAERLGRSRGALVDRARRIGVKLRESRDARTARRMEARPPGPVTRTDKPTMGWATGGPSPRIYVRVRRGARPPMPWTWEIHREGGGPAPLCCALRGYRSAEDAWEAGRAALAGLGRAGPR